jgi:hypothetical protein
MKIRVAIDANQAEASSPAVVAANHSSQTPSMHGCVCLSIHFGRNKKFLFLLSMWLTNYHG